jgi:sugar phosphate isomerase/epimerase
MSSTKFVLSAFGDEITPDHEGQLQVLRELQINYLELRGAWGKNVLHMDDDEIASVQRACAERGVSVSCIGSPVGKSPIGDPIEREINNLSRIFQVAQMVGTRRVRVFSFYPPDTRHPHGDARFDEHVEQATSRLARLTEFAHQEGFYLLLENEKGIVGDTLARCHAILSAVDSPHLRFVWDPANFVQVGEAQPAERGWPSLGAFVAHVHIKDAMLADGHVKPAGEGDGQVDALLSRLQDIGYQGFLALEPHLIVAGSSAGFSGAEGMSRAVSALRRLMDRIGCVEHTEMES